MSAQARRARRQKYSCGRCGGSGHTAKSPLCPARARTFEVEGKRRAVEVDVEVDEGPPPPGPPERLERIRERTRTICQRQIARIGRKRLEDAALLDQEIRRLARELTPEDLQEREEERQGVPPPVPFASAPRRSGRRTLRLRLLPVLQPGCSPRRRQPSEHPRSMRRLLAVPREPALRAWMEQALREHDAAVVDRPRTWGECRPAGVYRIPGVPEPEVQLEDGPKRFWPAGACPWLGCKNHLGLHVNEDTGSLSRIRGHDDGRGNCSLELAAEGPRTLEEVGELEGVTRERTRQMEALYVGRLREACEAAGAYEAGTDVEDD